MPETMLSLDGRPRHDCTLCRLGTLTVPCAANDVRRVPTYDETAGRPAPALIEGEQFHPVRLHRTHVVQGKGPAPCPVMLIGEAPGFHEDREGFPFVPTAPAGRVLQWALDAVGLKRWPAHWGSGSHPYGMNAADDVALAKDFVFVTNAVKCRPLDNKLARFPDALSICRDTFLGAEIAMVQPKVIVCLGKVAALPWFGGTPSLAFRQARMPLPELPACPELDVLLIHAPHPSNIARGNAEGRPKLLEALRVAKEVGYGVSNGGRQ